MKFSNLTNKEYFNLHGELSEERQRDLVDAEEDFKELSAEIENYKTSIAQILCIAGNKMNRRDHNLTLIHESLVNLYDKTKDEDVNSIIEILENYQQSMENAYDRMEQCSID